MAFHPNENLSIVIALVIIKHDKKNHSRKIWIAINREPKLLLIFAYFSFSQCEAFNSVAADHKQKWNKTNNKRENSKRWDTKRKKTTYTRIKNSSKKKKWIIPIQQSTQYKNWAVRKSNLCKWKMAFGGVLYYFIYICIQNMDSLSIMRYVCVYWTICHTFWKIITKFALDGIPLLCSYLCLFYTLFFAPFLYSIHMDWAPEPNAMHHGRVKEQLDFRCWQVRFA